ncbi:gamma-tubulin ring complex protein [Hysterangium stoloniferum]|nr:gamma-tubulin ring complex protein [Hysterangium stoloniferum]
MIAEILLILAGNDSSLFKDSTIHPHFAPLLHPGEQETLEAIAHIAARYKRVRSFCTSSLDSQNRYICALCSTISHILRDEYESLVIQTEARILQRDDTYVGSGSFVPISLVRAIFSGWDAPFKALGHLIDQLEGRAEWPPGPLIDLLLERANSGVQVVSSLFTRISVTVQKLWLTELSAFLIHGTVSPTMPFAVETSPSSKVSTSTYVLQIDAMPVCVPERTRDSILYIGRAVAIVRSARNSKQFPRTMAIEHAKLLKEAYPRHSHHFERIISDIRVNISEWLWLNVLTREDVENAVESLANYFLLRNGEFGLALIREIERLKVSRMISKPSSRQSSMIREQDLHLAMLRASLGTSAQSDPTLSRLRFILPCGPLRPLLPSLQPTNHVQNSQLSTFDDMLLGTPLKLTYSLPWPLDLFLTSSALSSYNTLFAFLSTVRKTHTRVLDTWVSLSNAQRARRRWTGTGEGGTEEDRELRERLLRCGWGCARVMNWFLEAIMEYVCSDVVDEEYTRLKKQLSGPRSKASCSQGTSSSGNTDANSTPSHLDFNTLRLIHNSYLNHLLTNTLVAHPTLSASLRSIFETCEQFVAQVGRWGGDVLPPLLFEGSLVNGGDAQVGSMVRERWQVVKEIDDKLATLLEEFYEQLSLLISQPLTAGGDSSTRSFVMNATVATFHSQIRTKDATGEASEEYEETRRHVERLLLRLDFSGRFSRPRSEAGRSSTGDILREGGFA